MFTNSIWFSISKELIRICIFFYCCSIIFLFFFWVRVLVSCFVTRLFFWFWRVHSIRVCVCTKGLIINYGLLYGLIVLNELVMYDIWLNVLLIGIYCIEDMDGKTDKILNFDEMIFCIMKKLFKYSIFGIFYRMVNKRTWIEDVGNNFIITMINIPLIII